MALLKGYCTLARAQCGEVARLEGEKAALATKLLAWAANLGLWFDDPKLMELADKMRDAALSDTQTGTAGEGWLPSEEVERLLRRYGSHSSWCDARNSMIQGADKLRCDCGFRAALDSLGGK